MTTAVFQAGLGDGKSVWAAVLDRMGPAASVFAYDRPGYGASDAVASGPRDPCAIARELRAVLRAAGVEPPYVLVGHSIGGLYQFAFAKLFPDEVAALLLVDPTHPEHWSTLRQRTPVLAAVLAGMSKIVFTRAMRSEFEDQQKCLAQLRALPGPRVPARILVRSRFALLESAAVEAMVREQEAGWLELLPGATRMQVDGAGHYIQKDRPDVVAEELRALLAQGEQSGSAGH